MKRLVLDAPRVAYTGIAAVIVEWIALLSFIILDFSFAEKLRPISYFATRPATRPLFMVGFTVAGLLTWMFIVLWARKFIKISALIFTISLSFFIATALVPFHPELIRNLIIHERIAAFFAFFFVLGVADVAIRNKNHDIRVVSFTCAIMGFVFGYWAWRTPGTRHYMIFLEVACTLIAQYWRLWLSGYLLRQFRQSKQS